MLTSILVLVGTVALTVIIGLAVVLVVNKAKGGK